ncbi:hypothetical protein ACPOL_6949 (plasmid) [Acidisarcina polymorpha]|uniref:Uncharacterized protein n=1 Tax=Acidisarcina polymorpha TaxID=2211140 RepID=A0A2Z5GAC1_9BACT|nr:hypothetical protein ACPOL_6949 [Acidisarcina polymorpha]
MLEQGAIDLPRSCHLLGCAFQVHGIPESDGGHNQVQPAGAMPLILEGSIADLAHPIENTARAANSGPRLCLDRR